MAVVRMRWLARPLTCVKEDDDGRGGDQLVHDGLPDDGLGLGAREHPVEEAVPVPEHVGEDQVPGQAWGSEGSPLPCYPESGQAAPVVRLLFALRWQDLVVHRLLEQLGAEGSGGAKDDGVGHPRVPAHPRPGPAHHHPHPHLPAS